MYEQKIRKTMKDAGFPDWLMGFDDLVTVVNIATTCEIPHGMYHKYIIPRAAKIRKRAPATLERSMRSVCKWAYTFQKDRVESVLGEIPVKPDREQAAPVLTGVINRLREKVMEESEVIEDGND